MANDGMNNLLIGQWMGGEGSGAADDAGHCACAVDGTVRSGVNKKQAP
ncbi:MAG: hypothetical protein ACLUD2_09185 [Clostridium sp.]